LKKLFKKFLMLRAVIRLNRQAKNKYSNKNDEMVKKALVLITEHTEESEAVIPVDTLRRAGVECLIAGVDTVQPVTCAQRVRIVPDVELSRCFNDIFDLILVPGGPGSENLANVC
jgi:putative intracellular protease/amidase